jgi:hypothetical protein
MTTRDISADTIEDLRLLVYRSLAGSGVLDTAGNLGRRLGLSAAEVDAGLRVLHRSRDLVLDDTGTGTGTGTIVLAHPFATRNFGFSVMGETTLWWGGCAWDAFAIPHLVPEEPRTLIATRCPHCHTPLAWNVDRAEPPVGNQVVHFATPMARVWDDVVHACTHQRIYCSDECLEQDLAVNESISAGARFDLPTLWRLARHWYAGRLDRGYRRREPSVAAAYFTEVGLHGPFWSTTADAS